MQTIFGSMMMMIMTNEGTKESVYDWAISMEAGEGVTRRSKLCVVACLESIPSICSIVLQ